MDVVEQEPAGRNTFLWVAAALVTLLIGLTALNESSRENAPIVTGKVLQCSSGYKVAHQCVVQFDDGRQVIVNMPTGRAGDTYRGPDPR